MSKKILSIFLIILSACLLAACENNILTMRYKAKGTGETQEVESSKIKKDAIQGSEIIEVYVITPSYENPFFKAEAEALTKKIKEYGYQVRAVSHVDDAAAQQELFQEAIEEGAAAIICDNADSHLSAEAIWRAKDLGIATILIDRGIEEEGAALAQILSDNAQGARLVAEQFIKKMEAEGKYIELVGLESDENASIRSETFHSLLDLQDKMELVAKKRADWNREKARKIVEEELEKDGQIKGIICGNDTMALGALDAVKAANLDHKVFITGMDGSDEVNEEIEKGNIEATVLQPVDDMAELAAECVHNYLTGQESEQEELQKVSCILITAENVQKVSGFQIQE